MSVHTIERRRLAPGFDVRWRSPVDGSNCARRFEAEEEAEAFDAAMKARLALDRATAAYAMIPEQWRQAVDTELAA